MFSYNRSFNQDISNWNVSNVTNMSYMFYECKKLKYDKSFDKWNVSNVTDMESMFKGCNKLYYKYPKWYLE